MQYKYRVQYNTIYEEEIYYKVNLIIIWKIHFKTRIPVMPCLQFELNNCSKFLTQMDMGQGKASAL